MLLFLIGMTRCHKAILVDPGQNAGDDHEESRDIRVDAAPGKDRMIQVQPSTAADRAVASSMMGSVPRTHDQLNGCVDIRGAKAYARV
jgi:hypothetical protein